MQTIHNSDVKLDKKSEIYQINSYNSQLYVRVQKLSTFIDAKRCSTLCLGLDQNVRQHSSSVCVSEEIKILLYQYSIAAFAS